MNHHHKAFLSIGAFFLLLFLAWVFSGGPQQAKDSGSAYNRFQEPLYPLNTGGTYNDPRQAPAIVQ